MNPDRWRQIDSVFQAVLESDPDLRLSHLDQTCKGDPELRDQVATLLAAHENAGEFIDVPAIKIAAKLEDPDPAALANLQSLGPYQVLRHLASGGMGEVYLAQDTKLDRRVALKVLRTDFSKDPGRIRRFKQEARSASALNHPNIITIYDIGSEQEIHYIATEFVEGSTIRQRLTRGRIPVAEALGIAIQAANALQAAHRAGIVHRDIKPENIMVRPDGYVKVLDFGLAKLSEPSTGDNTSLAPSRSNLDTEPGIVMGTARYMSPEQARGLAVDGRTDIFSLGVVLYEMLTGVAPFEGATPIDAVAAMLGLDPDPLDQHVDGIPPGIEAVVLKALKKDREERYSSIESFLAALNSLRLETEVERGLTGGHTLAANILSSGAENGASLLSSTAASAGSSRRPVVTPAATAYRSWLIVATAGIAILIAAAGYTYLRADRSRPIDNNSPGPEPASLVRSIAILPFVDTTGDKSVEYLSDGLTESLIDRLSRLPRLTVMSQGSIFRYKGKNVDPRAAGLEMKVSSVLSGRLRQQNGRLSIGVDLLGTKDNRRIWGREYSGGLNDILTLVEQMSNDVSTALLSSLTPADQKLLAKQYTISPQAYVLYSKGRFFMNQRSIPALRQSVAFFQQAADADPDYALAYDGLADAYTLLADYGALNPDGALQLAQKAAARALAIDDTLPETHTTLARLKLYYRDWTGAETEFKRAIEVQPAYPAAHQGYANYYAAMGRFGESISEISTAMASDPLSPVLNQSKGFHLYLAHQYQESIEQLQKTAAMNPDFVPAHVVLGMACLEDGMNDQAKAEFQKCVDLSNRSPAYLAQLARAYAITGARGEALKLIAEMKELERHQFVSPYYMAIIDTGLGDNDDAFQALDKAYEQRCGELMFIKVEPTFEPLHSDPRFAKFLVRMGLDR